ncbi:MAG: indolepyruvate oxidoreductase subunit beta [Anaerolineaceae bacterium]
MFSFPNLGINTPILNFLLVGVGGQGTILASNVLAELGLAFGHDVKKAEVHGMSQRGGSVISHVRWGEEVHSPIIAKGDVDILIAFEKLEALRFVDQLRPDGVIVINDHNITPVTVSSGNFIYPSDETIKEAIHEFTRRDYWVNGVKIAEELGNNKISNVVILGALCGLLNQDPESWFNLIAKKVPGKSLNINGAAFFQGISEIAKEH